MLQLLTEYLTKTDSVTIPHIGSIVLERQSASWSVADQELFPPLYGVALSAMKEPSPAQLDWMAAAMQQPQSSLDSALHDFGLDLQKRMRDEAIFWPGIGWFQWRNDTLELTQPVFASLPPISASKVIREDARHTIRVGEQEIASNFYEERKVIAEGSKDLEWLAWLLAVLAALFIFYCIYSEGFSPQASGLKTTVSNNLP